ncbi:hypothetical protein HPB50_028599 [Hyalomma asiaticum]|nr:hypothetical protein HPB50_028599 [Hyalomma asiaticum]
MCVYVVGKPTKRGQSWTRLVPPSAGHRGSPGSSSPDQPLGTPQPRLRSRSAATFFRSGTRQSPWPLTHLKRPASFAPPVGCPKYTGANTRTGPFTELASPPLQVLACPASRRPPRLPP